MSIPKQDMPPQGGYKPIQITRLPTWGPKCNFFFLWYKITYKVYNNLIILKLDIFWLELLCWYHLEFGITEQESTGICNCLNLDLKIDQKNLKPLLFLKAKLA